MSPGSYDSRTNDVDYDDNNTTLRRDGRNDDLQGAGRLSNMPVRNRRARRRGKSNSPASRSGMQRRRNKHWNW